MFHIKIPLQHVCEVGGVMLDAMTYGQDCRSTSHNLLFPRLLSAPYLLLSAQAVWWPPGGWWSGSRRWWCHTSEWCRRRARTLDGQSAGDRRRKYASVSARSDASIKAYQVAKIGLHGKCVLLQPVQEREIQCQTLY